MKASIPQNIIVDTCFWFALYNPSDGYHKRAIQIVPVIENSTVLIPWPSLYEVLNTEFVKKRTEIARFETFLKQSSTKLIDDKIYKEVALQETMHLSSSGKRHISLVDMVIRRILMDTSLRIDYLITFNERDFVDVCKSRRIQIFYGS